MKNNFYLFFKSYCKNIIKYIMGIGDWGLGQIPNPQSPLKSLKIFFYLSV